MFPPSEKGWLFNLNFIGVSSLGDLSSLRAGYERGRKKLPWLQQGAYRPSLRWICERISGHSIAVHADCKLRTPVNGQVSSPCKSTFPVIAVYQDLFAHRLVFTLNSCPPVQSA